MTRLTSGDRSVAGRVALVTGSGSGIGRATAHLLADEGAKVAVVDRDGERVLAVLDEIRTATGDPTRSCGVTMDVADDESVAAGLATVRAELGPIDILVNNAGVSVPSPIDGGDEFSPAWAITLEVNLTAHARTIRACLDDLAREGLGRVVNIASTEGLGATPGISAYTASKHGVIGLTRALAVELGRRGVTVNAVCPGPIRTGMTAVIPEDAKAKFAKRRVPIGRYAEPEEVAHAILGLVLPACTFINGAVLAADGGLSIQNV